MRKLNRYGKTQGQIYRTLFLIYLGIAIIIGVSGFGAYKILKPKYQAYKERKELEELEAIAKAEQEEKERIAQQEEKMRKAIEGGTAWNGHTYKVFEDGMNWEDAKLYCEDIGGHLVIIESQEEQTMLESILGEKNFYWLGASIELGKTDSTWRWVNGEHIDYSNWHGTQPDNFTGEETCLMMYNYQNPMDSSTVKGVWNDAQNDGECNGEEFFGASNSGFICEWDI